MRRFIAFVTPFAILTSLQPARAGDADPDIQSTILAQIDAFNHDDAMRAESFASPGIKEKFPDAAGFLGMVKSGYAPLVHPRSTHFEAGVSTGDGVVQHVTVVDKDGVVWTAVYTLVKTDGRWTISGCVLVKSPETTA